MPFFKVTIGVSLRETDEKRPSSDMYLAAKDQESVENAFKKGESIFLLSVDTILKIEEVSEEEVSQHCRQAVINIAKQLVDSGRRSAFHIDSKKII